MDSIKKLSLYFLMFVANGAFACSCGFTPLLEKYQRSDFIATAKISKVVQDSMNKDYHDINIELISLYKGDAMDKLKVISVLNSSCSFLPPENSIWLIFASKDHKGFLSFGFCSGSEQIDRQFDLVKYPNLPAKYKKSIDLKLEVLSYLRGSKISSVNKFNLTTNDNRICSDDLKGFKEENRFAVYELEVTQNLTIGKIKALKKFSNRKLSEKLTYCLKDNLQINTKRIQTIPEKTKLLLIYFYYLPDEKNQSFITTWDL